MARGTNHLGISRRALLRRLAVASTPLAAARLSSVVGGFPTARAVAAQSSAAATSLTLATNRTPSDLDPHSAYDAGSGVVLQGPFEGLIRVRPGTIDAYVPQLATAWEANADHSVWTFHLREGVGFQDGTEFDAAAARASFDRLLALGLAPASVLGRFFTDVGQIATPDSRTLVFDLGRPQPLFEAAIAAPYGTAIVNAAALRRHDAGGDWGHGWAQTNSDGLGTGPYRVASFDGAQGATLERFDGYWGGWSGRHFDRIAIRVVTEPDTRRELIERGDADIVQTLPLATIAALTHNPDLVVDHRYNLAVWYIAMTVGGTLRSPQARQALCWAFPYDDAIAGVYDGFAKRAVGPVAELCRGFASDTFVYRTDLDRARSLLRQAGVADGTTLTLMLPPGNADVQAVAELFQANLTRIGLPLAIQQVDFPTYVSIFTGDQPAAERPNLLPSFWQPDYDDGWSQLWPQVSCGAWRIGNGGHYCNQQVETLLAQAKDAADDKTYLTSLARIQDIVTRDDPAAVYFAQPEWVTVLRRDVGGFAPNLIVGEIIDFYALRRS
ncbi:MAG TPA: ABC transporter substrate-binding protein [Thermomicrobiales bacterium]|nr:ABC transporter substrate-binding protein [Thermomicrobiales bacterium]